MKFLIILALALTIGVAVCAPQEFPPPRPGPRRGPPPPPPPQRPTLARLVQPTPPPRPTLSAGVTPPPGLNLRRFIPDFNQFLPASFDPWFGLGGGRGDYTFQIFDRH